PNANFPQTLPAYMGPNENFPQTLPAMDYPKFQGGPVATPYATGPTPMYRDASEPYFDPNSQLFTPYAQNQSSYGVPYFEEDEQ
ncbi:hypothetical protein, partial [Gottfriedia acidiceleris]